MRIVVRILAILALFATNELRAEGPVFAGLNRFFGVGWGDGYHVGWNGCPGRCGSGECGANCLPTPGSEPRHQAVAPAGNLILDSMVNNDAQAAHFARARSQVVPPVRSWQQTVRATSSTLVAPRVIRLPAPAANSRDVSARPASSSPPLPAPFSQVSIP